MGMHLLLQPPSSGQLMNYSFCYFEDDFVSQLEVIALCDLAETELRTLLLGERR